MSFLVLFYFGGFLDNFQEDVSSLIGGDSSDTDTGLAPIAYWSFDEIYGNYTLDESGNEHIGIIHGATITNGIVGNALSFDGNNDYVEILDPYNFKFVNQDISYSLWVKIMDNTNEYRQFIVLGDSWKVSPVFLLGKIRGAASNGSIYTHLQNYYDDTCAVECVDFTGSTLPKDEWIHIVSVADYPNKLKLYVNGQLQGSSDMIDYDMADAYNLKLFIGAWPWSGGIPPYEYHYGLIDEVYIFDRALNSNEISQLYNVSET